MTPPAQQQPPSKATGLLLNLLLPGLGCSYLGFVGWHLAWFGIGAAALFLAFFNGAELTVLGALILLAAYLGCQLHYTRLFQRRMQAHWAGVNRSLIGRMLFWHVLLGVIPLYFFYGLANA